jgi:hypothetical protein
MDRRPLPAAIAEYVCLIRINGSRYSVCEKKLIGVTLGSAN